MDYFNEYRDAKMCLYELVDNLFNTNLRVEDADRLGIPYYEEQVLDGDVIMVCSCKKIPLDKKDWDLSKTKENTYATRTWELLELKKPIITYEELYEKKAKLRIEKRKDIDYYDKYLNMGKLIADLVLERYAGFMYKSVADAFCVKYNSDQDEEVYEDETIVNVCRYNYKTTAEMRAWKVLGLKDFVIGRSVVENIRNDFNNKLMHEEKAKVKEIGGYSE